MTSSAASTGSSRSSARSGSPRASALSAVPRLPFATSIAERPLMSTRFCSRSNLFIEAAIEVADANGWPHDWLNSNATMFVPAYGADPEWEVLYANDDIKVEVASPRALLAMKLNASRPGRDVQDIANLLAICDVRDLDAAEEVLNNFFRATDCQTRPSASWFRSSSRDSLRRPHRLRQPSSDEQLEPASRDSNSPTAPIRWRGNVLATNPEIPR